MTLLAELLSTVFERGQRFAGVAHVDDGPITDLTHQLVRATDEVSGLSIAQQILQRYAAFADTEKLQFFRHLAQDMAISGEKVRVALAAFESGQTRATYRAFIEAAEPPRQELVRRLNQVPGATGELVRMRADLLRLGQDDDALMALDLDFRHLFASWFNRGFLVLRPINWQSPAHILEKIIAYEAVHAIDSWSELRRRLQPTDRRCFAFFHPAMPDEPLIFVEVALTRGVPGSVQALLAEDRVTLAAESTDTAAFYSISNCQAGLAGVSFGNSLIKQVASDLALTLPGLKTFVTLSPIPGFCDWLKSLDHPVDPTNDQQMRALAAHYLYAVKRSDGLPLDPVARFHLGNGAQIHQVHAGADTSARGMAQSTGVMVNYLYDLRKVSQNHENFASAHQIAASSDIRALSTAARKLNI